MASYFQFLTAFIIFLAGIQEGLLAPSSISNMNIYQVLIVSIHGFKIFWAGPATSQHTCQCGIMNNCIEETFNCNSDSLAPIELFDEGSVTNVTILII